MNQPDANNAAAPSSAATAVADNWDEHGTPIVTQKPEPPKKQEESAASAPPAKVAKPEDKAAEPGAAKQEPTPKAKPTAEARIAELTAERKAAEKRASDLEERLRKLESAAQPTPKAEPKDESKPKQPPAEPNPFEWTGTKEEYAKAKDEYRQYRESQLVAQVRQELAQVEVQKSMAEMMKKTIARYPDAEEKIKSAAAIITAKAPAFVQVFVNESDAIGQLLYKLGDASTLNNLLETAKTSPGKALRVLRDMELEISKDSAKPEAKVEVKAEEKAPEPKPRAPKPPSEVGGRGAATEDAATVAARDGKFGDFEAEQQRKYFRAS